MNKTKKIVIGIGIAVIAIVYVVCINFWSMGCDQTEIDMATFFEGQKNVVETSMDNMINTIVNQHQVNRQLAKDIITVSVAVAEAEASGRKGGSLFKSSTEASKAANTLGIPETTYIKIMNTVQGEFDEFKSSQDLLTSLWVEHQKWVLSPHHNNPWYALGMGPRLKSRLKDKPEMISSQAVKDAQKTKTYDGTNLTGEAK